MEASRSYAGRDLEPRCHIMLLWYCGLFLLRRKVYILAFVCLCVWICTHAIYACERACSSVQSQ